jgi:hypothetical protein
MITPEVYRDLINVISIPIAKVIKRDGDYTALKKILDDFAKECHPPAFDYV